VCYETVSKFSEELSEPFNSGRAFTSSWSLEEGDESDLATMATIRGGRVAEIL
jgi:hypothetical protein